MPARHSAYDYSSNERNVMESRVDPKKPATKQGDQKSEIILVSAASLDTLQARPSFLDYIGKLWQHRYFILSDGRARAFASGRGMFLGAAWIVLNPAIQVALYAFVFGYVLKISRGMENFIGFLIVGVIFFSFISSGLSSGVRLIQANRGLLKSFNFPKATVALSKGIKATVDNIPALCLAVVAALISQYWITPSWTALLVIPLYILLQLFLTGLILFVGRLTAFVPDIGSLITVVTRILYFTSGVFWPIERFVHDPVIAQIVMSNPCYQFLDAARSLILDGEIPGLSTWVELALWSLGSFVLGLIFFWRAEHRYAAIK